MPEQDSLFSTIKITPPADGACSICATQHPPHYPHNRHSVYYQMRFRQDHGQLPTMDDAMAHCREDVKHMIHYVLTGEMDAADEPAPAK